MQRLQMENIFGIPYASIWEIIILKWQLCFAQLCQPKYDCTNNHYTRLTTKLSVLKHSRHVFRMKFYKVRSKLFLQHIFYLQSLFSKLSKIQKYFQSYSYIQISLAINSETSNSFFFYTFYPIILCILPQQDKHAIS